MNDEWMKFWGDYAEYDICEDCELIYEEQTGMSCVLWTPDIEKFEVPSDDLKSRPNEYSTHGFTGDFEDWGIKQTTRAIESGCKDVESILKFIKENPLTEVE